MAAQQLAQPPHLGEQLVLPGDQLVVLIEERLELSEDQRTPPGSRSTGQEFLRGATQPLIATWLRTGLAE